MEKDRPATRISVISYWLPLLLASLSGCSEDPVADVVSGEDQSPEDQDWEMVWQDEFNGSAINILVWDHEVNGYGGGNNEMQYYTDRSENSYVSDGTLKIVARAETYTGDDGTREYTSARMRTAFHGDWLYGRFEVRAKLPVGQGLWPAIWMLPTDWEYGGWPLSGEIDIMELLGHDPNTVYGTIHYGDPWPDNAHTGDAYNSPLIGFDDRFHTFAVEWDTTAIHWYVDDDQYLTLNTWYTPSADYPAPFDKRLHLLLNVAVGGNWPGDPDETTVFPQTMEVDFVRVYRRITD